MNRYRVGPEAQDDLDDIYAYVAERNVPAADRLITGFKKRFRLLATQPFLGQARPDLAADLRSFVVGNYVIFYRPAEEGIDVARIIHAARDIDAVF